MGARAPGGYTPNQTIGTQRQVLWSQVSFALQPPQSVGQTHWQLLFGSQTSLFWQVASQLGAHSQAQEVVLHTVLSGQPPQSTGQMHAQSFVGSQVALPGQFMSQFGSQAQSHVEVLQMVLPPQAPPQSDGHWQLQAAELHSRLP